MKKTAAGLIFCLLGVVLPALGQENRRDLFERTSDSLYTFYFDSQYYLTEKGCEFFSTKRSSNYSKSIKAFEGKFTDTDTSGSIVLTGAYQNGRKQGTFKGFYPNGFLKWQADFKDGSPTGLLYYYYPDGSPMSIIKLENGRTLISNYWNEKGKPMVQNGTGKFELIDPQFGYNVKGFDAVIYRGRVKNGRPDGTWTISYRYQKGENETIGIERFKDGSFLSGTGYEDYSNYKISRLRFSPSEPFSNAELFIAKNCNVDEHYNFTMFLSEYLSRHFEPSWISLPADEDIELELSVDMGGRASKITLTKGPAETIAGRALLQILYSIPYWIPSQKEGQLISDTLKLKLNLSSDRRNKIVFSNVAISRANGS